MDPRTTSERRCETGMNKDAVVSGKIGFALDDRLASWTLIFGCLNRWLYGRPEPGANISRFFAIRP